MPLRRDTALRLRYEVPDPVARGILDEFDLGRAANSTEAIRLIIESQRAEPRVRQLLLDYAGRCSVVWLLMPAAEGDPAAQFEAFDFSAVKDRLTNAYGDSLFTLERRIEPSENPDPLWAEDRDGQVFVRLVQQISERYHQVGLDLLATPVVATYTLLLRPQHRVIEIRAPWTHFRDVFRWAVATLQLQVERLRILDLRGDVQAAALQAALDAKLKRARHKHDQDHDYDTQEVTPNPHRNDGDLSLSATYQEELAPIPGRGKYFALTMNGQEEHHLVQVAQTNFAVVFRTMATERLVTHVLNAALATGARSAIPERLRAD